MILSQRPRAVWCETLDDVTLIWDIDGREEVEFVQVKAEELDQLWSVARLCQPQGRSGAPLGTSVLEKSLAHDRCCEPCRFRIVTRRPPGGTLTVLESALDAEVRALGAPAFQELRQAIEGRLNGYKSHNGHDLAWWLEHTVWEVAHSEESLRAQNLILITRVVEELGNYLVSDQREQLYELLLQRVHKASSADKTLDRHAGKLRHAQLREWLATRIMDLEHGGSQAGGRKLKEKLDAARVSVDTMNSAEELRRSYLRGRIQPRYLVIGDTRIWEDRVRARLNALRASLDSGEISDSGVEFHARTLKELQQLPVSDGLERPPEEFLQGCMYFITDVCQHRFVRADI